MISDKVTPYPCISSLCRIPKRYIFFRANIPKTRIGVKVAKNDPIILYLMFADDHKLSLNFVRLFFKSTARNVKKILEDYCKVSGQSVNSQIDGPIFQKD